MAMTSPGWADRGAAPGNLPITFDGSFRSVQPPRGPAAGQAGEQTAPFLSRHAGGNEGISRSGREGRRLGRRWRRSLILDALPVVLLATSTGARPFAHICDTTAEHGQHKSTSRAHTSTEGERNTTRPARSNAPAGEHATRRFGRSSAKSPPGRDLRAWAASLAAAFPPLTELQVAAVAKLAAHLDAEDTEEQAA